MYRKKKKDKNECKQMLENLVGLVFKGRQSGGSLGVGEKRHSQAKSCSSKNQKEEC